MPPQSRQNDDGVSQNPDETPTVEEQPHSDALAITETHRKSFIAEFASSKGPPQIILLIFLFALGFGSTIGVVPAVMTDRYARLNHGYDGNQSCASLVTKPEECLLGSADSQNAVAYEQLVSNVLSFFTSSLIGSLSDEYGRKVILVTGITLSSLQPLSLVLIQMYGSMNPLWYYIAGASTGLVGWMSVSLSALSDVVDKQWRAASFGLLLAGFSLGFALAPQLALLLGHFHVSVMSLITVWVGMIVVIFFFPETLPEETALAARNVRQSMTQSMTDWQKVSWLFTRPVWELSILNRNRLFRLLSSLAFFSGIVSSADRTLLLYYLEERLAFNDQDVATLFLIMGLLGIVVQGFLLKYFNDFMGERLVVVFSFVLGTITNLLYGLGKTKSTIFVAVAIGTFAGMAFPTISAIKSNNVAKSEQGRIQGALSALQSLASGVGPMVMRFVYHYTKDGAFLGPGSMFVVAAALYLVAVYCAYELPAEANSCHHSEESSSTEVTENDTEATRPLLGSRVEEETENETGAIRQAGREE